MVDRAITITSVGRHRRRHHRRRHQLTTGGLLSFFVTKFRRPTFFLDAKRSR